MVNTMTFFDYALVATCLALVFAAHGVLFYVDRRANRYRVSSRRGQRMLRFGHVDSVKRPTHWV